MASQALVTSPPDGYTLIVVASGHPTNSFLYPKLPYDTFKDFTPISLLASPNILLVRANSPYRTLADLIAAAKAKPGSLSFAHAGTRDIDASGRRTFEGDLAGIDIDAIPYKGGAPAINLLQQHQSPLSFNNRRNRVGRN